MMNTSEIYDIFSKSVEDWHKKGGPCKSPFPDGSLKSEFYLKNQIDCGQWHLEDDIRDPNLDKSEVYNIKKNIDNHNQNRTDMVEKIDDYYLEKFKDVKLAKDATLNTETPAWAIDRLSILALKIYHMQEESNRKTADEKHRANCRQKLDILLEQKKDLITSIDQLFDEYQSGKKLIKVYRQMKMYNDPNLNPALYNESNK